MTEAKRQTKRWVALDALRILAVLLMVQGHTFFALLHDDVRQQGWYGLHAYVHGYTAPLFLFSAGCAFGLVTFRSLHSHTTWSVPLFRRCERYVLIVGLGYVMHWSQPTASWLRSLTQEEFAHALRVDALQHIGVVLLVFVVLVRIVRRERPIRMFALGIGSVAVFCAPWLWQQDVSSIHPLAAAYISDTTGSVFPLAPWMAFIAFGLLTGSLWDRMNRQKALMLALSIGTILVLAAKLLTLLQPIDFGEHYYWKTSPWFFMTRIGVLLVVLAVFGFAATFVSETATALSKTRLGRTLTQETLSIYVLHLALLYLPGIGLSAAFSRSLTLAEAVFATVCVITLSTLLAMAWSHLKSTWPSRCRTIVRIITLAICLLFLLG